MESHVPYYLQHQYNLYDRTPKNKITNICNFAEKVLTIDNQGNCFLCICDGWLPISVGHITDFDSMEEIWQTELAKKIQKDLKDKNYTWCSVDYCGIKNMNKLMEKYYISINIDESCNLQCPTCRSSFMNFTHGKIYENKLLWANHIVKLLERFNRPAIIAMSGNGDPFASLIYRPILMNLPSNIQHDFRIMTNGLLLKKLLKKTSVYKNIKQYSISIDAGDKDTYERVRFKGNWKVLIENLDFLKKELEDKKSIFVNLNFCLHAENYKSLKNFVNLVQKYNWHGTIQPLENWNTYENFKEHDVLALEHDLHNDAIKILNDIVIYKNISIQGMIKNFIKTK
jgi:organic radical activating enzyme